MHIGIGEENLQIENHPPVAIEGTPLQKTPLQKTLSTLQVTHVDTLNLVSFLAKIVEETGVEIESIDMQRPEAADPLEEQWEVRLQISVTVHGREEISHR